MKKFYYVLLLFFAIGIFALVFSSCNENSPTSSEGPPSSNTLGTLVINPNSLIVNNNDTVVVRVTVTSGLTMTDSVLKVIKVDNNNNQIAELGVLRDNGKLINADEIANDNVFSGKILFNESSPGTVKLRAKGTLTSSGNPTAYSNTAALTVYSQLTSQEFGLLNSIQTQAAVQLQTYLAGNPNNIDNASNQLVTWLQNQTGVQSVQKSSSNGIMIKYSSGLSGGLMFSMLDASGHITTLGGADFKDTIRGSRKPIPLKDQTVGENEYKNSLPIKSFDKSTLDPNTIGNRNVLIYEPFLAIYPGYNIGQVVTNRLNQSDCKGFNITSFTNQNANVAALLNLTNYGFVVITTHGLSGKTLFTGELVDTNAQVYKTKYKAMLKANKLSIWNNIVISVTGGVNTLGNVYTLNASFISDLSGSFPNSVIINNSCESSMNAGLDSSLAKAFIDKGAKTYFGYSKVVHVSFVQICSDSLTKRMAVNGMTSGSAFFNTTDPEAPNAVLTATIGSNDIKFPYEIINGDFELGTIDGWSKAGDGRVITRLGSVNPTQGTFMGIISTGLGYTVSSGSISQCVKVPMNVSNLKLKWNFLSEEFLEYIGSQYQDYYEIKIKKQDGTEVTLYRKTIDQIAALFGATQQNPGQLIAVSPGIVFDQGGVYMTNWQTSSFDVTPYRGSTITIIFAAGDVGDSIYDTAILIDEVKLE